MNLYKLIILAIILITFSSWSTRLVKTSKYKSTHKSKKKIDKKQNHTQKHSSNTSELNRLYGFYEMWRGTSYKLGGLSVSGVDCSGFIQNAFKSVYNLKIPRTTKEQLYFGKKISKYQLRTGDVVFFKTAYNTRHVGIYLENNTFMHASTSKGVTISSLNNDYWRNHYYMSRRFVKGTRVFRGTLK